MSRCKLLRFLILVIFSTLPACSAIVTYSDLASWQAQAIQAGATIDFSNLAPNPGNSTTPSPTLASYPEVTFVSPDDYLMVINPQPSWVWYVWDGAGAILRSKVYGGGSGALRVDLSTPASAFAALIGISAQDAGGNFIASQMSITVNSGAATLATPVVTTSARPTLTFFGVAATDPGETFDSITFTPAMNYVTLDDVRLGSYSAPEPPPPDPGAVPEPGTGVLALCGAAFLAAARIYKWRERP